MDKFKLKLQIQEFCSLLLEEESSDDAFEALQELNRCKLPKILLKHVFSVVWKHCLTLYYRRSFQECLRWSEAAFNMNVCLGNTTDLASIATVIADIYLQTREWSKLERHVLLFREHRQPFMEHMFNLEMALCREAEVAHNLSNCLEHAASLDDIKKITNVLLNHNDAAVLSKYSLSLLKIVKKTTGKDFSESEVAMIFSIVLILACDGDFLDVLMEVLGDILEWNRKLTECLKENLEIELRTIMDHCENWIDSKLKESASHVSKEMLEVGKEMCAVLLMLYDPKEDMPHTCRTLSHQTQLLCKLEGIDTAKKHLLRNVQSLPQPFVRQILLDVQLDNLRFDPILRLQYFQKDGDKLPDNAIVLLSELNNLPKTSTDDKNDVLGSEILLRLAVAKLLEINNDLVEKKDLIVLIEQLAKQLFQHVDTSCSTWLSNLFYEIGLISKNSTILGFAAKLQTTDFSIRSRLRAIQLNASFQNVHPSRDEIAEAVKEIMSDDLSTKDYEEMKLFLILKFKGYLLLEDAINNDVKDLVSVVIRHKDWATLEIYAALLMTMGADKKLLLKCLRYSNTMALHDGQVVAFWRTGLLLIREFVEKLDIDSINNLVPQFIALASPGSKDHSSGVELSVTDEDEVQVLILLVLESLVNLHQRQVLISSMSKKQVEVQTELKSIISSLTGLVNEDYTDKYGNQLRFEKGQ